MAPYDPILDYCGIVIQFGYVTFFSVVWQVRAWHVHSLRDMRVACAVPCAVPCTVPRAVHALAGFRLHHPR